MKNLYIITEHDFVTIKDADDDDFKYPIRKQELPLTRDGDKSEWIMHLLLKTWISTEILYKLAQVIQREFPGNKINWKETFFVVEKAKYLDTLGDVFAEKSESITKNLMTKIDFGQKETSEELMRSLIKS